MIRLLGNSKSIRFVPIRFKSDEGKFNQKFIRVTILGANTRTAEAVAFQLKQNPLISQIHLFGNTKVLNIVADLEHIDTRSRVFGYYGSEGLPKAIRQSDVILMLGSNQSAKMEDRLYAEKNRVAELANACAKYAPKSMLVVCVQPVSGTLPIVAEVYRKYNWFHPGRIIGSVAHTQIKVNAMAAQTQGLNGSSVNVPLSGGPDCCCTVPLFSRATPLGLIYNDCKRLTIDIRNETKNGKVPTCFGHAYGINHLVTSIGLGLIDHKVGTISYAFVRQSLLPLTRYFVCAVRFGPDGIMHNYGLPRLSKFELKEVEKSTKLLRKRDKQAKKLIKSLETNPSSFLYDLKNGQCSDIPPVYERICN